MESHGHGEAEPDGTRVGGEPGGPSETAGGLTPGMQRALDAAAGVAPYDESGDDEIPQGMPVDGGSGIHTTGSSR